MLELTNEQINEIQNNEYELKEIRDNLVYIKNEKQMPKGKAHLYTKYVLSGLIKMSFPKELKNGGKDWGNAKIILTKKGKEMLSIF